MRARLILADRPGAFVTFTHAGREFRARMDPMWLGVDVLAGVLDRPGVVLQLLDEASLLRAASTDLFGRQIVGFLEAYLVAAGLSFQRLGVVLWALRHVEALEVDLLRLGLDVRDWLDPEGCLSTRRVALLVEDFRDRPETRLGALFADLVPISKEGILAAQNIEVQAQDRSFTHEFLKSPYQIEAERRQLERDAIARERIKSIRPAEIRHAAPTCGSFVSAREESRRALSELLEKQPD